MCFYDQHVFTCGDYKWGLFRQHCNREYRTGETCGMKLIMTTNRLSDKCKLCDKIDIKQRRLRQERDRVVRWQSEPHKFSASIAKSYGIIQTLEMEVRNLAAERNKRANNF